MYYVHVRGLVNPLGSSLPLAQTVPDLATYMCFDVFSKVADSLLFLRCFVEAQVVNKQTNKKHNLPKIIAIPGGLNIFALWAAN